MRLRTLRWALLGSSATSLTVISTADVVTWAGALPGIPIRVHSLCLAIVIMLGISTVVTWCQRDHGDAYETGVKVGEERVRRQCRDEDHMPATAVRRAAGGGDLVFLDRRRAPSRT